MSNEVQLSDSTLKADLLYGGGTKTGDVRENTLRITGGADVTVTYAIGGSTEAGAASDNKVTLEGDGTKLTADMLIGGWAADGAVSGNTVTLSGGTAAADRLYGGGSGSGDAVNNTVSVTGGTVETKTEGSEYAAVLAGGYSQTGHVKGNLVDISGGSFTDVGVYGGKTDEGDAVENKVHIDSGKEIELWSVVGGDTVSGTALGNVVTIEGDGTSLDANEIGGGWSTDGEASWNNVTLRGAVTAGLVYGGGGRSGDAVDNAVYVSGAVINEKTDTSITPKGLAGGFSETGDVSSNFVSITEGSSVKTDVYGGRSKEGTVAGNGVEISGADTVVTASAIVGGWSESGSVLDNDVTISGGNVTGGFDS